MTDAEEIQYDNDCLVISIDIVDCPMAEIPLTEVFDVLTKTLVDIYHDVIRDSVRQQLEHTTWLSADLLTTFTDPGFGMYHARDRKSVIMLRKPALQRLVIQRLKDWSRPSDIVHVPVLIRFLLPDVDIPRPPSSSTASDNVSESQSRRSRAGPPSIIDTADPVNEPTATEDTPVEEVTPRGRVAIADIAEPGITRPTFQWIPVDTRPVNGPSPSTTTGRFHTPTDPRPLFNSATRTNLANATSPGLPPVCIRFPRRSRLVPSPTRIT